MNGLGYSCAKTAAIAQVKEACSDGNEAPPLRKGPCGSSKGRLRPNAVFKRYEAMAVSVAASAANSPVSFAWLSCFIFPYVKSEPGTPPSPIRPASDNLRLRLLGGPK